MSGEKDRRYPCVHIHPVISLQHMAHQPLTESYALPCECGRAPTFTQQAHCQERLARLRRLWASREGVQS